MKGPIILPDKTSKTLLMFLSTLVAFMGFWLGYLQYRGGREAQIRNEQVTMERRITAVESVAAQVKDLPVAVARVEEIVKRVEKKLEEHTQAEKAERR